MTNTFPSSRLLPGDKLMYNTSLSLMDACICLKTGSKVAHIEEYLGDGRSFASRNGIGVNVYALRMEGLVAVLRPKVLITPEQHMMGINYIALVKNQKYDWLGLMAFWIAAYQGSPGKQFCSELMFNFDRARMIYSFNPSYSADGISPNDYMKSPIYNEIWKGWK